MAQDEVLTGIVNVDQATDPAFWVHYLDTTSALQFTQALKRRTLCNLSTD